MNERLNHISVCVYLEMIVRWGLDRTETAFDAQVHSTV